MDNVLVRIGDKALFAVGVIVAPVALVAPRAMAVLLPLLFLIFLLRQWRSLSVSKVVRFVGFWEVLAFIAFAALSLLWVADPDTAAGKLFPLSVLLCVSIGLLYFSWQTTSDGVHPAVRGFAIGVGVTLAYLGFEVFSGGAVIRNIRGLPWEFETNVMTFRDIGVFPLNRGITMVSIFVWPVIGYLAVKGHARLSASAVLVTILFILLATPQAPMLGMLLGGLVFLVVCFRARTATLAMGALFALCIVTAPLLQKALPDPEVAASEQSFIPSSGVLRLAIWERTVDLVDERPWTGWGFLGSRMFYDREDKRLTVLTKRGTDSEFQGLSEPIPLHPHNAILQWWLELGLVGAAIFAVFVFRSLRALARQSDRLPKAVSASVAACFVSASVSVSLSYGAWQTWWVSGLALSALMCLCLIVYTKAPSEQHES